jgi:hypothetical protein
MNVMKTYVEFQSDAFPAYDGEQDEVNPGIFGKRLAEFLSGGLTQKGFQLGEPVAEDWGWMIPLDNEPFKMWIGCGNYEEHPNGFLCFIEPHQRSINKYLFFGKIDTTERVTALQQAMDELLESETSVINKKWSTHEEFNSLERYH